MEKQKTAVDWLIDEIEKIPFQSPDVTDYYNDVIALFTQAKEMEKEQIVLAASIAFEDMFGYDGTNYGIKYYNETYGKYENKAENHD